MDPVGVPIDLSAEITPLDGEDGLVFWFAHQGPAAVSFDPQQSEVPGAGAEMTTSATFSEPGEYMVRVTITVTP